MLVGARREVGTTTVAVNLAAAVQHHDKRSLLVDAHPHRGDATTMLRLADGPSLGDVLSMRRPLIDVVRPGPAGMQVVPGVSGVERLSDYPSGVARIFASQLHELAGQIDWALVDAGTAHTPLAASMIDAADMVVIVTTDHPAAIMDAYTAIGTVCRQTTDTAVLTLINRAASIERATDAAHRLETACRRFLGFGLTVLGPVADDPHIARLAARGQPVVAVEPGSNTARAITDAAGGLVASPRIRRPVSCPNVQILGPFRAKGRVKSEE